jgi:hypothetical protein
MATGPRTKSISKTTRYAVAPIVIYMYDVAVRSLYDLLHGSHGWAPPT